jgi:GTPase SAR1 family protein
VVYDVTKEDTFKNAQRWMEEMRASAEPECVICLVGNQVDRVEINPVLRQVEYETAKKFADANNLKFEETSALTNKAVTDVFDNLLHYIYEVKLAQEGANGIDQLAAESKKYKKLTEFTSPEDERKKSGCC